MHSQIEAPGNQMAGGKVGHSCTVMRVAEEVAAPVNEAGGKISHLFMLCAVMREDTNAELVDMAGGKVGHSCSVM